MSAPPTAARLPSLDGLRAISIMLVLCHHLAGTAGFPKLSSLPDLNYGNLGVRVFFVISGYLISTLLFGELARTGGISLSKFYFRRGFRIFPAFYVTVAIVSLLASLGHATLARGDVLHAVTYTTNYHPLRGWSLGHMWSLAVEEQFYLLWPAAIALLGKRRGLHLAAAFVLLAPVIRVASLKLHLGPQESIGESFQTVGDSIAAGCLLAGFQPELRASALYRRLAASPAFLVIPVLVVLPSRFTDRPSIDFTVGQTAQNLAIALLLDWCIVHHDGAIGRLLNARPVAYVGTLSYALYLAQQLFLNRHSAAPLAAFPQNLLLAIGAALALHYVIERPFLRWRERLEPRWFPKAKRLPAAISVADA